MDSCFRRNDETVILFFLNHLTSEAIPFLFHMADDEVLDIESLTIRDRSIGIRQSEGEIHTLHSSS